MTLTIIHLKIVKLISLVPLHLFHIVKLNFNIIFRFILSHHT
jgi:hypothetical protein